MLVADERGARRGIAFAVSQFVAVLCPRFALHDELGFRLSQRFAWQNPSKMPVPAESMQSTNGLS